jgi:hypothetical protein
MPRLLNVAGIKWECRDESATVPAAVSSISGGREFRAIVRALMLSKKGENVVALLATDPTKRVGKAPSTRNESEDLPKNTVCNLRMDLRSCGEWEKSLRHT